MAIEDYYINLEVWRRTSTKDAYTKSSDITGVINTASQRDSLQAKQQEFDMTHKMYCPVTSDINSNDQVRINLGGDSYDIYRVEGQPKNTLNRNHHYKIMLNHKGIDNNG